MISIHLTCLFLEQQVYQTVNLSNLYPLVFIPSFIIPDICPECPAVLFLFYKICHFQMESYHRKPEVAS